jgi:clan AA aspartic protease (TIGR02281 family)
MTRGDTSFNSGGGPGERRLRSPFLKGQQLAFCARCGARLDDTGCVDCGWVPPVKSVALSTGISHALVGGSIMAVLLGFGGLYLLARINLHNWYPDEAKAKEHMRLAHVKYEDGSAEEAFVLCDQAITCAPRDGKLRLEFAQLLEKEAQTDQALEQMALAVQYAPADKEVLEQNAVIFDRLSSDEKETLARYEKVLAKFPKSSMALFWGARTAERLAEYDKARDLYRRELKEEPVDGTWCGLARTYQRQGNISGAINELRHGIQAMPDSAALHYELGLLLAEQNQKPQAIVELKKSIDLNPYTAEWTSGIISKLNTAKDGTFVMVPLEQIGDSFIVNVVLNHKKHAKLIVDSGAESCVISTGLANGLGLDLSNATTVEFASATGYGSAAQLPIDTIAVGKAHQNGVVVDVVDLPDSNTSVADGLLGMSFLKRYKFSLDAKHQLLQLQAKD